METEKLQEVIDGYKPWIKYYVEKDMKNTMEIKELKEKNKKLFFDSQQTYKNLTTYINELHDRFKEVNRKEYYKWLSDKHYNN